MSKGGKGVASEEVLGGRMEAERKEKKNTVHGNPGRSVLRKKKKR